MIGYKLMFWFIMLAICFIFAVLPKGSPILEVVAKGSCGLNLKWSLNTDGVLTIAGRGNMYNFRSRSAPWYGYRNRITAVVVEDGVTAVAPYAFCNCTNLTSVVIPESVTVIKPFTFCNCKALSDVVIPDSISSIGSYAFCNCRSLKSIEIPGSNVIIVPSAFRGCVSLNARKKA